MIRAACFIAAMLLAFGPANSAENDPVRRAVLQIWLNGAETDRVAPVLIGEDAVHVSAAALAGLGLILDGPVLSRDNVEYYDLSRFEGLSYRVDAPRLFIECPSTCFAANSLSLGPLKASENDTTPSPAAGAYLNYDFVFQANEGSSDYLKGFLQAAGGLGRSRWTTDGIVAAGAGARPFVRLDSAWISERPAAPRKLVLGDSISDVAAWAHPYRFAGIQYGSDYSLQPTFITYALPSLTGDATLPSVVDLYINGVRFESAPIRPGPFETGDLPLMTGGGQLRMNVTDLLGRETTLLQSVYIAPQLLRAGLTKFTLQAGALRKNYGVKSFDYGEAAVSARLRHGLDNSKSIELYGEAVGHRAVAGGGLSIMPGFGGVVHVDGAAAFGDGRGGRMVAVGYEWLDPEWSFAANGEWRSAAFRLPSDKSLYGDFRSRILARLGKRFGKRFGGTISFIRNKRLSEPEERIIDLGTTLNIFGTVHLNFLLRRSEGSRKDTLASLSLSVPLGGRQNLGASFQTSKAGESARVLAHRTPDRTEGWGYRAEISRGIAEGAEASLMARGHLGDLELGLSERQDTTAFRANVRGGLVFWGGYPKASRYVDGSYAVVAAPAVGRARVYHDSQYVGRLDRNGKLLITGLRPFERNKISIEARDLLPGQYLDSYDRPVLPYRDSGVAVDFSGDIYRSVIVTLRTEDGAPLEFGTRVLADAGKSFVVGRAGRVNLRLPVGRHRLSAQTDRYDCDSEIEIAAHMTPGQQLPAIVCRAREQH